MICVGGHMKENLKFEFTEQEAQIILNALVKEPYGQVVEVINSLQKQAAEQMQKPTV